MVTSQQFPNLGAALVTNEGLITQEWRQFLLTLWARTGSAVGGNAILTGTITAYAGAIAPGGWLLCDGSEVARALYPNLFSLIGSSFGSPSNNKLFKLPNATGKSLFGTGAGFSFGTLGGSSDVTLETKNIPAHTHEVSDTGHTHAVTDTGHTHVVTDPGHTHASIVAANVNTAGAVAGSSVAGATASAITGITLASAASGIAIASANQGVTVLPSGEGAAFKINPPYLVVNWIIKV